MTQQPRDYMEPLEDDAPTEDEIRRQLGFPLAEAEREERDRRERSE